MQPIPRRQAALAPPAVPVSEAPPAVALPPAVAAAVWRGDQLGRATAPTRSSGFAALDAQLPGGGWPCQGLTELLQRADAGLLFCAEMQVRQMQQHAAPLLLRHFSAR